MNMIIVIFLLVLSIVACSNHQPKENKKPNVVIIFTDDQDYADKKIGIEITKRELLILQKLY